MPHTHHSPCRGGRTGRIRGGCQKCEESVAFIFTSMIHSRTTESLGLPLAIWLICASVAHRDVALMSDPVLFSTTRSSFTTAGMFTHSPRSPASPVLSEGRF